MSLSDHSSFEGTLAATRITHNCQQLSCIVGKSAHIFLTWEKNACNKIRPYRCFCYISFFQKLSDNVIKVHIHINCVCS